MTDERKPPAVQEVGALPSSYASVFQLTVASNDISLSFGTPRVLQPTGDGNPTQVAIEWTHSVIMSPQSAKQLAELLTMNVAEYEKIVGSVSVPSLRGASPSSKRPAKRKTAARKTAKRKTAKRSAGTMPRGAKKA